jgi:hypothetical protein
MPFITTADKAEIYYKDTVKLKEPTAAVLTAARCLI